MKFEAGENQRAVQGERCVFEGRSEAGVGAALQGPSNDRRGEKNSKATSRRGISRMASKLRRSRRKRELDFMGSGMHAFYNGANFFERAGQESER